MSSARGVGTAAVGCTKEPSFGEASTVKAEGCVGHAEAAILNVRHDET